jgi:hypothetical protein
VRSTEIKKNNGTSATAYSFSYSKEVSIPADVFPNASLKSMSEVSRFFDYTFSYNDVGDAEHDVFDADFTDRRGAIDSENRGGNTTSIAYFYTK